MTTTTRPPTAPALRRAPARPRVRRLPRRPALALGSALAVLGLIAAACGGGDSGGGDSGGTTQTQTAGVDAAAPAPAGSGDFASTRPGAGIAAAGGNPQAVSGGNPCAQPAADPVVISYVGANLAELDAIGLEAIIVEEPGLIIGAYINEVNFNGGINGHCVEFAPHLWSLADPVASFTQICTDMAVQRPVFYFSLGITDAIIDCATRGAQIPVVALYASDADSIFVGVDGRNFFLDDGSVTHILHNSLGTAARAATMGAGERVGLLHGSGASAGVGTMVVSAIIERHGFEHVATAQVPAEQADLQLLLEERNVRLLESGLSDDEQSEAERNLAALPPELAGMFQQMEDFYIDAANAFRDSGVDSVVATADWSALRRMMRAAERIGWSPQWIANDMQPATLTMQDAPPMQAENLRMVSNRRAAGDAVSEMDRGCITLRNTASDGPAFAHRLHTDGWTLITSVCDYLDVAFSALTRIDGPITSDTFIRAMNDTEYETDHGAAITFSAGNRSGGDRFRVLQADPECVLNSWGCMRPATEWFTPSTLGTAGGG